MKLSRLFAALLMLSAGLAAAAERSAALPRSAPEAQGVSSSALLGFIEEAEQKIDALHSVMIVRHGKIVAEGWWAPYAAEEPHQMFSLSKSFTSTAVGLAIADGKLSVDDLVLKFFPEEAPEKPSNNLKAMRVRDLLTMSTGHHAEDIAAFPFNSEESLVKKFLALPVTHKPGTLFIYNTPATYMLSAIVQKVTGQTVLEYLRPRLFAPLGIDNPTWEASKQGVSLGGYGLSIRTEDIAKFGQLYLQRGMWNGKQLVPASWVATATSRWMSNGSNPASDWDQGYGFQFWR
jgi:CubicO group peptidase (beta-lactamase class C family)